MLVLNKIRQKFQSEDKKRLLENFLSLSILQGANYILPLITLPYLVRVLGPEKFGLIAFAQSFIQYFNILTDYGFNLSATREISIHRDNKEKVSEIFSSVMIIKFGLLVFSFIIMGVIVFSFEKFKKDWLIYYLTFGMVVGQCLFPVWFFQGIEKMKYITFLNIIAKLIFTSCVFIFVRQVSDYIYVPLINSTGFMMAGVLAIWIIIKDWKIKLCLNLKNILLMLKLSFQFFLSRAVISLYTNTNSVVVGLFLGYKEVAYYDIAYKIVNIIRQPWDILNTTVYPYVSKKRNIKLLKNILKISLIISLTILIIFKILAEDTIPYIFGTKMLKSVYYSKILIFILPLISVHIFLGSSVLVAQGLYKYFNLSNILASIFYLLFLGILIIFNKVSLILIIYGMIFVDLFILIYRFYYVKKYNLLKERSQQ